MFYIIVVMLECSSYIVWRVNVDALYLSRVLRLQRFEGEQIVPVDEHVFRLWGGVTVLESAAFSISSLGSTRMGVSFPYHVSSSLFAMMFSPFYGACAASCSY